MGSGLAELPSLASKDVENHGRHVPAKPGRLVPKTSMTALLAAMPERRTLAPLYGAKKLAKTKQVE